MFEQPARRAKSCPDRPPPLSLGAPFGKGDLINLLNFQVFSNRHQYKSKWYGLDGGCNMPLPRPFVDNIIESFAMIMHTYELHTMRKRIAGTLAVTG